MADGKTQKGVLPCPFCGQASPHGDVENTCRHVAIVCLTCGARGPLSSAQGSYALRVDEASAGWNTRHTEANARHGA